MTGVSKIKNGARRHKLYVNTLRGIRNWQSFLFVCFGLKAVACPVLCHQHGLICE